MLVLWDLGSPWRTPELVPAVKRFLLDHDRADVPDSVLATLLFTDIVGSTERTLAIGDRAWRDLLAEHQRTARHQIAKSEAASSTRPAMASLPPSTARVGRSPAREKSSVRLTRRAWRFAQESTPASASCWATNWPALP